MEVQDLLCKLDEKEGGLQLAFFKKRATEKERVHLENEVSKVQEENLLLRAILLGGEMTREKAMNIPSFKACVNRIADSISTLPVRLYKIDGDKKIEIKDEPRVKILNDETGDTLTGTQFKKAIITDYLLGKGGYAYIKKCGNTVKSIHYVSEKEVTFVFNSDPIFKEYDIIVRGEQYKPYDFIKVLKNTENGRDGISVIEENKIALQVSYYSLIYERHLVQTGGNKKGFITSEQRLDEPSMNALKEAWRNLYQNNSENVIILNKGLKFQESSNTSVEMQLNENKKTNADEICKLFNMPPRIISGGANEEDRNDYVQNCIIPAVTEFACALNRDLLLEKEKGLYFFAFDLTELTKGDIEKRYKAYEIAVKNGFLQTDEVRFKENMPALGLNFVKLGLQDVLYNTVTKEIFIPNMNAKMNLGKEGEQNED